MALLSYLCVSLSFASAFALAHLLYRTRVIPIPDEARRIGCIDGLRGYLALAVMFYHYNVWLYFSRGMTWDPTPIGLHLSNTFVNFGGASVGIFFMITGALFYPKITGNLAKTDWSAFYISRFFRLVPVMWFAVAMMCLIAVITTGGHVGHIGPGTVFSIVKWLAFFWSPDLFNVKDTWVIIAGVTWSLRYEWLFYLGIPLLAGGYSFLKERASPLAIVSGCLLISLILVALGADQAARHVLGRFAPLVLYIPLFVIGMLTVELTKIEMVRSLLLSSLATIVGVGALLAELVFFSNGYGVLQYLLLGIFLSTVVAGNSYFGLFAMPASIALGTASYGIYLTHGLTLFIFMHWIAPTMGPAFYGVTAWLCLPLVALVVVFIAALEHIGLELPGIRMGHALGERVKKRTPITRAA